MPYRDGFAARISEKNRVRKKNRDIDMNTFSKFLDRSVLVSAEADANPYLGNSNARE